MRSLYSNLGIQYQQAYSGIYHDMSVATDRYRLVIAKKHNLLSGFGRPIICFGDIKSGLKIFRRIYNGCSRVWYMSYDGLDEIGMFLLEQGKTPEIHYTQVIDLRQNYAELHSQMRKSYQNLVNKYEPIISFYPNDINKLKQLHIDVCGYQTRPDMTWDIQKSMIEYKEAFIVHSPSWDAAGLFIYNNEYCYYGVGKSMNQAYSHPVLWKAICHAKRIGCTDFEMGQQFFVGDKKQIGISMFKRGFGGTTQTRLEFKEKE